MAAQPLGNLLEVGTQLLFLALLALLLHPVAHPLKFGAAKVARAVRFLQQVAHPLLRSEVSQIRRARALLFRITIAVAARAILPEQFLAFRIGIAPQEIDGPFCRDALAGELNGALGKHVRLLDLVLKATIATILRDGLIRQEADAAQ